MINKLLKFVFSKRLVLMFTTFDIVLWFSVSSIPFFYPAINPLVLIALFGVIIVGAIFSSWMEYKVTGRL